MSNILYFSKYCEVSKRYLQLLSRTEYHKNIHFVCIDKRVKEMNKTYIILDDGKKMILPENVTKVPALMLLNQGYQVLYGEQILQYFKSAQKQEVKQATQNNMEPMAFSLGGGTVVSDNYSFLDQAPDELEAKGDGGMRQMHNYVDLNTAFNGQISGQGDTNTNGNNSGGNEFNTTIKGLTKNKDDASNQLMEDRIKKMKEERDADIRTITGNRPPIGY